MTAIIREGVYAGEFVASEGESGISRDRVVLARQSATYAAGTVLGQLTVGRKHCPLQPGANTGAEKARAILLDAVDASGAADTHAVAIARLAQVKAHALVWPAGITDAQKQAAVDALDARAIVVRS